MLAEKNEKIRKAYNILEIISKDDKARAAYESREAELHDQMTRLKSAREEGLKEGLKEATIKNAKNFLLLGLDVDTVAKGTGLSVEEVENIKGNSIKSRKAGYLVYVTEGSKTVTQKPDNILSINKIGSDKAYEFIFDAKYKIDTSEEYQKSYGGIGPKEEDINTMHRYRDAIVYKNKKNEAYNNSIFGAFVLFPYKDEEGYRNHDFYKSIEEVNIGGIPFLPSTTGLMEEFLDKLINESS